jgi:antitoxin MazE
MYLRREAIMKLQLSRWGNSLAVRLPKNILDAIKIKENDFLDLQVENGNSIVITPAVKKYNLAELLAGITPENSHSEMDWGNPTGGEEW